MESSDLINRTEVPEGEDREKEQKKLLKIDWLESFQI